MRASASIVLGLLMGFLVSFGVGILVEERTELFDFTGLAAVALVIALLVAGAAVFEVLEPRLVGASSALVGVVVHVLVNDMQITATLVTIVVGAALVLYGQAARDPTWTRAAQ